MSNMLTPDNLEKFLSYCTHHNYIANSDIICPGDAANKLYYLTEGSLSVMIENEIGRDIVLAYINEKEFIGEIAYFIPMDARTVLVRSRTPCKLAEINYDYLNKLFEGPLADLHAKLLHSMAVQVSHRLLLTSRKVSDLAFVDVTGRIASTLQKLAKEPDAITHPDGMQVSITRRELAHIVGCSRELAGKVLKELEQDQGLIYVKGKKIVVFHEPKTKIKPPQF